MKNHPVLASLLAFGLALSLTACSNGGDSSSSSSASPEIRLVNLTNANDLKLTIDSTTYGSNVASGSASPYSSVTAGTYTVIASSASGILSSSTTTSVALVADTQYTTVAYERGGQIRVLKITETTTTPSTGFAILTVNNVDSDAGMLDVYVVAPGTDIGDLTPTYSVPVTGTSLSSSVTAGTYDIVVTSNNNPGDVRLKMTAVQFTSTEVANLVLTPTSGGALVDGALVEEDGAVSFVRNSKARVRVVAALPAGTGQNPVIRTTVGGTTLSTVTTPSVGSNYDLVPAGATTYTVSIDNVPLTSLPDNLFASGGDYTILVYGTSAPAADVNVLRDNNRLPGTGSRIRLVNGGVATAGLALSANSISLVSEVFFGDASAYSTVTAGSNVLVVTSPAVAFTTYSTTQTIASTSVYTLFVLNYTDSSTTKYVLTKDR